MTIKFLYWPDCPSYREGLARLEKVIKDEEITAVIEKRIVSTDAEAESFGFSGSPTILINEKDIDLEGLVSYSSALTCRIYRWPDGRVSPLPSEEMIRSALKKAMQK